MLDQRLQQKLLQKLSPQQIQLIKLLEVPTMLLEQRIKKELEENPALEEGEPEEDRDQQEQEDEILNEDDINKDDDEFSLEDYLNDEDTPSYRLADNNYSKDDDRKETPLSFGASFQEHLESQLGMRVLTESQMKLAEYIIGNIDEDGYLRREIDAIIDDLAFLQNVTATEKELLDLLFIIQDFDPAGVGARDLQECLILQLERKNLNNKAIAIAHSVIKDLFTEFTKKHYDKIIKRLNITEEDLKTAITEILKLNPKPGSAFNDPQNKTIQHIIPDFILENIDGDLQLSLNSRNVPELRVSRTYAEMLIEYSTNRSKQSQDQKDAVTFVKQKLDSAKWFIDAIKQRQNTLLVTMNALLNYQREYFIDGDETKLRPMILKDIADITKLDISTISRVANSKYIQTNFGIIPLKFFFSEGMQTESGEEVSTREIKKILQDCIGNENKRKPVTDERLAEILQEKGYQIARRTVAKYREQLGIQVARLRKNI